MVGGRFARSACLVSVMGACFAPAHVTLPVPPPDATPDQRVAAYEALSANVEKVSYSQSCNAYGCNSSSQRSVILANGTEVGNVEDLLPLVPADSETARHIHAAETARAKAAKRGLIGTGVMFGAVVTGLVGFSVGEPAVGGVGFGVGLISAIVVGVLVVPQTWKWHRENAAAFHSYNADLGRQLDVCSQGLTLYACDQTPPAMPDPAVQQLRQLPAH